jgi:Tfp pilus assembly protein PilN
MLRINLLPAYVAQRRLSKRMILGFAALFLVLLVGMGAWYVSISSALSRETQLADNAVAGQQAMQGVTQQAQTVQASVAPIQAKVDFVKAVHQYNLSQVRIYANLAHYTDPKIIYSDAAYSGDTMTIQAYTPSFPELLVYLPEIRKDPDFTSVTINTVPDSSNAYVTNYYVGHTLVSVGTPPGGATGQGQGGPAGSPGFGGQAGGGGFGGPGGRQRGGFGAPGGGPPSGFGAPGGGQASQFGQSSLSNLFSGTEAVVPLEELIQRGITPLTLPRQAAEYAQQVEASVHSKRVPAGFSITVTAILAHPFVPPVYGGSAAAGTTPGGPGGFPGGPPGGFPGGPPGGFPGGPPGGAPGGPPGAPPGAPRVASNG